MPIQVMGFGGAPFNQNDVGVYQGRFIRSVVKLLFSGAYPAGGDTLDLTNGGGTPAVPTTVVPAQSRNIADMILNSMSVNNTGLTATNGNYILVLPAGATTPISAAFFTAMKVKIYVGAGTEYPVGAYAADVLTDLVLAEIMWAR